MVRQKEAMGANFVSQSTGNIRKQCAEGAGTVLVFFLWFGACSTPVCTWRLGWIKVNQF